MVLITQRRQRHADGWGGTLISGGRCAMSEPHAREPASKGASLERSKEEVLASARALPPHKDMVIEDLTDEEERIFVEAILDA